MPEAHPKLAASSARGATVRAEALIATRFISRFIDVTGNTRALANLAGMRRARQRGRGVEFDEVRAYAAGDDVRAIDWRVTAAPALPIPSSSMRIENNPFWSLSINAQP